MDTLSHINKQTSKRTTKNSKNLAVSFADFLAGGRHFYDKLQPVRSCQRVVGGYDFGGGLFRLVLKFQKAMEAG